MDFGRLIKSAVVGLAATVAITFSTFAAQAQSIEEIKQRGVLRFAVLAAEQPYGFVDEKGESIGLDIDLAKLIAKELGVRPEFEKVIQAARIPSLTTGKVDLVIGALTMLPERAKVVQFSRPYMGTEDLMISAEDTKISSYDDLKSLRTAVARASTMDATLTENLPSDATILRFDDGAAAGQAFLSGQADAFAYGSFGLIQIQKANPDRSIVSKFSMNKRWTGIGMRKGQVELNAWLNSFLDKIEANGELGAINKKWLGIEKFDFPKSIADVPFTTEG